MARILVSGLINIETTLRVEGFPLNYNPANYPFFGVNSSVSGVGYNLAKALTLLGHEVQFLSLIGQNDPASTLVRLALKKDGICADFVLGILDQTAQSVILYDPGGRRQIHTDLKDIQEQVYPLDEYKKAAQQADLLVLCNINFSRPMLQEARRAGKRVATDVHAIASLEDEYNQDFMRSAQILFMSHENLPILPEEMARAALDRFGNEIVGIGLGAEGFLLAVRADHSLTHFPAVKTRPVVNTIGAGDALFSAFLHAYLQTGDPRAAARKAVVFASHKIGSVSAADGFLTAAQLDELSNQV